MTRGNVHSLLLGSMTGVVLLLVAGAAQAFDFKLGDVDAALDSTIAVGTGIRTSGADCTFVSLANGGCTTTGKTSTAALGRGGTGYEFNVNDDDGNVNSRRWNPYTITAKITSELQLNYENYGVLVRGRAYYDYWGAEQQGDRSSGFGMRPLDDSIRGNGPTDDNGLAGHGVQLLDAFVFGHFNVGEQPLTVRLGNQVVNWGESLTIQGGINTFLPIDVSALRLPGSELKDAYLPSPMIYAQLGLPNNFGLEAFYEFAWTRTKLDTCGTFFSTTDTYCEGGAYAMNIYEFNQQIPALGGAYSQNVPGVLVPRVDSQYARNGGQWGVKGSYYADWLNQGTDLGLYYVNFHDNKPIGTITVANPGVTAAQACFGAVASAYGPTIAAMTPAAACFTAPLASAVLIGAAGGNPVTHAGQLLTLAQYPEDIHMLGASFNTTIQDLFGGTAFSGEIAYSDNMPFQVSDIELEANSLATTKMDVLATSALAGQNLGAAVAVSAATPVSTALTGGRPLTAPGDIVPGYDREAVMTGQLSTISTFSGSSPITSFMGADQIPLVFNAGFQYLPELGNHQNHLAIPRSDEYSDIALDDYLLGSGVCPGGTTGISGTCPGAQYATSWSWGYRLIAQVEYDNAFNTAWTVSPMLQWAHDVSGYSAGPNGPGFIEGKKSITAGVSASLLDTWRVSLDWTSSFGNKFQNFAYDKDFAQINVSYAF